MNSITDKIKEFLDPLSPAQRTLFFGLAVSILVLVGTLFYWTLRPSYTLLFGSLKQDAAQEITQSLDERGVQYKLENGGQSIYVENDKVDKLRLELAPLGAPQSDMKGYELFDSNSLGMTDYMQQLNNRRALEGELSKSVNSLKQVESSRVHLVLPERSPFEETTVKASASVLLTLRSGEKLTKQRVDGITSLISGSVVGLKAADVTIVDHAGNRLTTDAKGENGAAAEDSWLKSERKTENYLTERGQSMLDRVLGPGNSILRVAVEQNFDSLVRESNNIDPESRTLISEQKNEEVHTQEGSEVVPIDEFTPVEDRGETAVTSTNEDEVSSRTRNYEVSKTKEVYKKAKGEISNISASVLLNHKRVKTETEEGETVWESKPYSEEELNEFREVLKSALGLQAKRGDNITIKQVEFWNPNNLSPGGGVQNPWPWSRTFRWGLILIALGIVVWLLNSLRKQATGKQNLILGSTTGAGPEVVTGNSNEEQVEGMSKEELQDLIDSEENEEVPALEESNYDLEEIVNMVELKPSKAAKVVRAMLILNDEE
ncbi:flagellar basal-body MS-ring/collar protein FliF [Fodinibius halophilus]|uniref:Flagellar M-ring protein n=1 Tax=Fodinibius halophilus TaxID=1736908 RepID=A0A6M1T8H4_9BACT|nr:flagellar basal-body MS-ring/collar protein FliF [Fodinibius halophilus]NGP87404.1 flagellar M-ring protein FliF [Fodinibius halophilus]